MLRISVFKSASLIMVLSALALVSSSLCVCLQMHIFLIFACLLQMYCAPLPTFVVWSPVTPSKWHQNSPVSPSLRGRGQPHKKTYEQILNLSHGRMNLNGPTQNRCSNVAVSNPPPQGCQRRGNNGREVVIVT